MSALLLSSSLYYLCVGEHVLVGGVLGAGMIVCGGGVARVRPAAQLLYVLPVCW